MSEFCGEFEDNGTEGVEFYNAIPLEETAFETSEVPYDGYGGEFSTASGGIRHAYSDDPGIIPDETYASAPTDIEAPPSPQAMTAMFSDIAVLQHMAFGSFIESVQQARDISPAPTDTIVQPGDEIEIYDTVVEEQAAFVLRQTLKMQAHTEAMARMGIGHHIAGIKPALHIIDGRRFYEAFVHVDPQLTNEVLADGAQQTVDTSLNLIRDAYIPPASDRDAIGLLVEPGLNGLAPGLTPEDPLFRRKFEQHQRLVYETIMHAPGISEALEHVGASEHTIRALRAAYTADLEGLLPQWAVAQKWGLYRPATRRGTELEWSGWHRDEDWDPLLDYLEVTAGKARPDSPFLSHLAVTFADNIHNRLMGIYAPDNAQPFTLAHMFETLGIDDDRDNHDPQLRAVAHEIEGVFAQDQQKLLAAAEIAVRQYIR